MCCKKLETFEKKRKQKKEDEQTNQNKNEKQINERQINNETRNTDLFDADFFGGALSSSEKNKETLLYLTPHFSLSKQY